jgi:hypothetical protein
MEHKSKTKHPKAHVYITFLWFLHTEHTPKERATYLKNASYTCMCVYEGQRTRIIYLSSITISTELAHIISLIFGTAICLVYIKKLTVSVFTSATDSE